MAEISGGDKLASFLDEISKKVSAASEVKVGFLEGSTYPDGTSVPLVAVVQEFGSPVNNIPPRPFFRNMVRDKSLEWGPAIEGLLKDNDYDAHRTLEQTGAAIAGQLKQSIIDTNEPPLKPATVKRKGFDKPLVDTGHMLNSVSYEVK